MPTSDTEIPNFTSSNSPFILNPKWLAEPLYRKKKEEKIMTTSNMRIKELQALSTIQSKKAQERAKTLESMKEDAKKSVVDLVNGLYKVFPSDEWSVKIKVVNNTFYSKKYIVPVDSFGGCLVNVESIHEQFLDSKYPFVRTMGSTRRNYATFVSPDGKYYRHELDFVLMKISSQDNSFKDYLKDLLNPKYHISFSDQVKKGVTKEWEESLKELNLSKDDFILLALKCLQTLNIEPTIIKNLLTQKGVPTSITFPENSTLEILEESYFNNDIPIEDSLLDLPIENREVFLESLNSIPEENVAQTTKIL